ncbi:MAG TPA: hypothetical protein VEG35_01190 [Burkholderiales bacterium]|nr:hypothetical protein [Burkholderiales bacterium]
MKKTAKFAVSMPEPEFSDIEALRRKSAMTRSQFVREAVRAWKVSAGPPGLRRWSPSAETDRDRPAVREEARGYGHELLPELADDADRRRRAIAVAGRFSSGAGDLSLRHDDYLEEAGRDKREDKR